LQIYLIILIIDFFPGSLFLRLLCPALLTPSLFALAPSLPNERASRTLTLTAKIVQSMANGARFGAKEDYLSYLNEVLDSRMATDTPKLVSGFVGFQSLKIFDVGFCRFFVGFLSDFCRFFVGFL